MSTTPAINCIEDRGLLLLQNYLRPPKSATAADIVINTAMKTRKGTSHTLIRGPGGRQNYFKPKWHYLVAAVADFGGRRYRRFIPFNFLLSLAAPLLHGVLVLVTGNKFIAAVVVTGDKFIAGVVVTGDKFFTGINDTGDH